MELKKIANQETPRKYIILPSKKRKRGNDKWGFDDFGLCLQKRVHEQNGFDPSFSPKTDKSF